jgi:hypothetical protein
LGRSLAQLWQPSLRFACVRGSYVVPPSPSSGWRFVSQVCGHLG